MSMSPNFVLIMALGPFASSAFPLEPCQAAKRAPIPSNRLPPSTSVTATIFTIDPSLHHQPPWISN